MKNTTILSTISPWKPVFHYLTSILWNYIIIIELIKLMKKFVRLLILKSLISKEVIK